MSAEEVPANGCNLDVKNPHGKEEPVDNILAKEIRIAEIKDSLGAER